MKLKDYLSESETAYYESIETHNIAEIPLEKMDEIKEKAELYRSINKNFCTTCSVDYIIKSILYGANSTINNTARAQKNGKEWKHRSLYNNFETPEEVLVFIVFVIDKNLYIAQKYLSFLEQTNSNSKALLMYKSFAETFNHLFDSKLLQAELLIKEREREIKEEINNKRTTIG